MRSFTWWCVLIPRPTNGHYLSVAVKADEKIEPNCLSDWILFFSIDTMGTRVYIGGLPYRVKERDIERFFRGYGKLREVLIKNGYGFVVSITWTCGNWRRKINNSFDLLGIWRLPWCWRCRLRAEWKGIVWRTVRLSCYKQSTRIKHLMKAILF